MAINNNTAYNLVKAAYSQALGGEELTALNLQGIIDEGDATTAILANRDEFTKALILQCARNWFTDTSYRSAYRDVFFEDEREYGAIVQAISVTAPEVQPSHAWKTFTSGTTTAGEYTLFLPEVSSSLYGATVSWELPIAITGQQWDDAFVSGDALGDFVAYVMMIVDNAIVCHLEDMNAQNRNNFIAEKYNAAGDDSIDGVHVINLTDLYNTERSANIATTEAFLKNADCMRFAAAKIDEYTKYLGKMSKLFNTANKARFTPDSRKVVQIVKKFSSAMDEVSYSQTYNAEYVKLPNYEEVPYWQAFGESASWDEVTTIKVKTASSTGDTVTTVNNVVAFVADKWACAHTIRSHRVAVTKFDPEDVTQYYYQFRDSYMNNLSMNAIVFVVGDATP